MHLSKSYNTFTVSILLCLTTFVFAQKAPETIVLNGNILAKNQKAIAANKDAMKTAAFKIYGRMRIKFSKRASFILL